MADDKNTSDGQKDQTQQLKLLLMIVICVAVVIPLLSTTMTINTITSKISDLSNISGDQAAGPEDAAGHKAAGEIKEELMLFYKPMEFLVNLADVDATHYLRTTVSLGSILAPHKGEQAKKGGGGHGEPAEEPQPEIFSKIKSQEPVIRDSIISVISTYPLAALVSAKGKRELKETIKKRLQLELKTENLNVYFTDFTLQ